MPRHRGGIAKMPSDALTQKIRQPRVGLLRLGQFWDILVDASGSGNRTGVVFAWIRSAFTGNGSPSQHSTGCVNHDLSISRICTHISMAVFLRATAEVADQGSRTLSADAELGSPRQSDRNHLVRRERFYVWGRDERISGLLKNMRRMRLLMVPLLDSWNCILY